MPAWADTAQAYDHTTQPSWSNVSLHLPISTQPSGLGQATAADPRKQGNTVAKDKQRQKLGEQNEWVWQTTDDFAGEPTFMVDVEGCRVRGRLGVDGLASSGVVVCVLSK